MCNCLKELEKRVIESHIKNLEDDGKKIDHFVDESESGFQTKALMLGAGKWSFTLPMEYKYVLQRSNGEPEKRITRYKTNFSPAFCPVCGEKQNEL